MGPYFFSILSFIKLAIVDLPDPDNPVIQKEYLFSIYFHNFLLNHYLLINFLILTFIKMKSIKFSITELERKIISNKNRYKLGNIEENKEIKKYY